MSTRWQKGGTFPSEEAKAAGRARKKRNRELVQTLLGMRFVGLVEGRDENGKYTGRLVDSPFKQTMMQYFGLSAEELEDMSYETAIRLRQIGQAIEKGDQVAADALFMAAYGRPREFIDMGDDEQDQRPVLQITVIHNSNESPILETEIEPEQTNPDTNEIQPGNS